MKKIPAFVLLFCLLLLLAACGGKEQTPVAVFTEGLRYEALDVNTCAVTGRGSATGSAIIIPANAPDGKMVSTVGANAFENDRELSSVTLPATVRTIEARAFAGCTALASFSLPDKLECIRSFAFSGCSGIERLYLGSSLREVGDSAFYGCTALQYAFFRGDATTWGAAKVGSGNSALVTVLYLYSDKRPTDTGRYWYYSGGQFKLW